MYSLSNNHYLEGWDVIAPNLQVSDDWIFMTVFIKNIIFLNSIRNF